MSQRSLKEFGAYRKGPELFDCVVTALRSGQRDPLCFKLVSQQVVCANSICANIEEGRGRLRRAEYVRFLDLARGSAPETRGRYLRMAPWLEDDGVRQRAALADEITGTPTATIERLRAQPFPSSPSTLREEAPDYGY